MEGAVSDGAEKVVAEAGQIGPAHSVMRRYHFVFGHKIFWQIVNRILISQ